MERGVSARSRLLVNKAGGPAAFQGKAASVPANHLPPPQAPRLKMKVLQGKAAAPANPFPAPKAPRQEMKALQGKAASVPANHLPPPQAPRQKMNVLQGKAAAPANPLPAPKATSQEMKELQSLRSSTPPGATLASDAKVQNWLDDAPSSVSSFPISPVQGPETENITSRNVLTNPNVRRTLFTKASSSTASSVKGEPTKRPATPLYGMLLKKRKASNSAVRPNSSPGTDWRKVAPTITVVTTISPNKTGESLTECDFHDDESDDSTNNKAPNITVKVVTSERSPQQWTVNSNIKISRTAQLKSSMTSTTPEKWTVADEINDEAQGHSRSGPGVVIARGDLNESIIVDDDLMMLPLNDESFEEISEENTPQPPSKRGTKTTRVVMDCSKEITEFYTEEVDVFEDNVNESSQEEPKTTKEKKRTDAPRDNTRKRVPHPEKWLRTKAREKFNSGMEYVTKKGNLKKARAMKDACHKDCNRCSRRVLEEERLQIFEDFWNLESVQQKRDFISRLVIPLEPKTCSTSPENAKKATRSYNFIINNEEEVRVCKKMFINTLGVADCWVETTLKKMGPQGLEKEKRGRHDNRPIRLSEETIDSVRNHIKSFPRVYSHYTRERSKREYLETHVKSVERMYEKSYLKYAADNQVKKPASISCYRKVFNEEFNLGFFLPKKDQCETCNKWKFCKDQTERRAMVAEYALHLKNKKEVNALHRQDSKNARKNAGTGDNSTCVACFDLQKVLICPRSETSIMFYLNKLSMFNFTVFDVGPRQGYCYLWTEVDAGKGANEIGTCLLQFISKKVEDGVKEFRFYSDAPSSQNRNRMVFSMYLYATAKHQIKITHRFLESGHSYSEADSIHARIEIEANAKAPIFSPEEWIDLIKNAKQEPPPYQVKRLENQDVLDLHHFVNLEVWGKDTTQKQVYWSKVREVTADHLTPNVIYYRYNFSDEPSKVKVTLKSGGVSDMGYEEFPAAYQGRIPLKPNKKKDLKTLMEKGAIPSKYFPIYEDYMAV